MQSSSAGSLTLCLDATDVLARIGDDVHRALASGRRARGQTLVRGPGIRA
jgi:hypothetical protein